MTINLKTALSFALAIAVVFCIFSADTAGQRRDYMTDAEIEVIRDAQDIDHRIDVLTKMIDRRLLAAGIESGGWAEREKDLDKWGPKPAGTRLELLADVRRLLQKAIDDIDDVAEHDSIAQEQNRTKGVLFPKAVRMLAAASERYRAALAPLVEKAVDEKEKGTLLASIESSEQIIEAAAKLPSDTGKKRKKS